MSDAAPNTPNVFLSWSMDRSKDVATALRSWLPRVIQACDPWMSAEDIHAGKRWRREIAQHLADLRIGVLCLTPENVERPWINFEAGALSRSVTDDSCVIPYCFGLGPADYGDPLGDFNGVTADRDGTLKLVRSINRAMDRQLRDEDLDLVFERMWGDLKAELDRIPAAPPGTAAPRRSDRELLEEILARVRDQSLGWVSADGTIVRDILLPDTMGGIGRRFAPPGESLTAAAIEKFRSSHVIPRDPLRGGSLQGATGPEVTHALGKAPDASETPDSSQE
jgi:hypothetical protein